MPKYPLIRITPPGPNALKIIEKDQIYLMHSFTRWYPLVVKSGDGFLVEDVDGNIYLDFNSGIAVMNVGHRHPAVISAIERQIKKLLHYSITDFIYRETSDLAEKLVKITPGNFKKKVFFGNSGAEAIEASIKISRGFFKNKRPYIISFIGGFHGRTIGSLSLTASKPIHRKFFSPLMPNVIHIPYPYCYRCPFKQEYPSCNYWCIDFIEEWVFEKYVDPEEISSIFFEPILGEGGYIVPPPKIWKKLERLAKKYDILLVADEIQTGIGRTGRWFASEHWNIKPDIIAVAKAIASGLPLGVVIGRKEVMSLSRGSHASTFGGNPISCAAANAVIDIISKERLLENASRMGEYMIKRLKEYSEKFNMIGDVRGKGLMIGVELVKDRKNKVPASKELSIILQELFRNGVLAIGGGVSTIRFAPPLIITKEAIDKALEIVGKVFSKVLRK